MIMMVREKSVCVCSRAVDAVSYTHLDAYKRQKYNYVIKCNQVTNDFNCGNSRSNGYLFSHRTLLSGSFSILPLRMYTESI